MILPGRNTVLFGLTGLMTGIVTWLIEPFQGPVQRWLEEAVPSLDEPLNWVGLIVPGALFGLALAWRIGALQGRSPWRMAMMTATGIASWYLAIVVAVELATGTSQNDPLAAAAAGATGSAIMVAGTAIAYRTAWRWRFAVPALGAGTAVAFLLLIAWWALFPLWQATVAASLGWAFDKPGAPAATPPTA